MRTNRNREIGKSVNEARVKQQTSTLDILRPRTLVNSNDLATSSRKSTVAKFAGARSMGMPFKEAVEFFLMEHYKELLSGRCLCLSDLRHDPGLYQAVHSYKKRFGHSPFGIPSIRDKALDRFNRVVKLGYKTAERRDRDAANRYSKKLLG